LNDLTHDEALAAADASATADAESATTAAATEPIMEDFVFGGIEADESRLLTTTRARFAGVRHEYAIHPLDPQPGEAVTLTVTLGADVAADRVTAYVTTDGTLPSGTRGNASNGVALSLQRAAVRWEPLIWGYVAVWQGEIPAQPEGTFVQYIIEAWRSGDFTPGLWSREQHIDRTEEARTLYAYSVDRDAVPTWAHEAIVYQIFVDRFRNPQRSDAEHGFMAADQLHSRHFWGGTLRGILEKIDEIAALGVTVLWLTPVFRTSSNHGYDTTDYYAVDPRFGTLDDLRALVQAAHSRGLRVVLDLVVNHTGLEFAPFARARSDRQAAERTWFSFGEQYTHGFRTFFDVPNMPQLNLDDPGARAYILDVARYWLRELDVDGYRLDYAAGPSLGFWSAFRRACHAEKPGCWLFGEVTLAGDRLRAFTGRLDGCLDFAFARAVRGLCLRRDASVAGFAAWLERHRTFFGPNFTLPAFLDNHDMNRFLYMARDDKQTLRLAVGLLFALGGAPVLYYGTEVGLSQPRGKGPHREESRHPMLWGETQDADLRAFFARWIAVRRAHAVLTYGDLHTLQVHEAAGIWLAERRQGVQRALVAVNISHTPQVIALPAGDYVDAMTPPNQEHSPLRGKMLLSERSVRLLLPRT
jgi:glycosidase